jgi:hypothetical protein
MLAYYFKYSRVRKAFGVNISQNNCEKLHILPWIPVGQDGLFALTY